MRTMIACLFTLYPPNTPYFSTGSQRETEFVNGFRKFREIYEQSLIDKDFFVVLIENTVKSKEEVPLAILNEWSPDWHFLSTETNEFGIHNKGAGILENYALLANHEVLQDYDWIIHFEPRLTLKDNSFFETFNSLPNNYFTKASSQQYFTGLFSMKTETLIDFVTRVNIEKMVETRTSLEDLIFQYMKNQPVQELEKVSCIWHDAYAKTTHEY